MQFTPLYGAPIWASEMTTYGWKEITEVQRRMALRVAMAYCTVSTEAMQAIADILPIELMTQERKTQYESRKQGQRDNQKREELRTSLDQQWQDKWEASTKGRWTFRLIKNIERWRNRQHGKVNFNLTQVLSGHGCFAAYLHKYQKLPRGEC